MLCGPSLRLACAVYIMAVRPYCIRGIGIAGQFLRGQIRRFSTLVALGAVIGGWKSGGVPFKVGLPRRVCTLFSTF